MKRFFSTPSLLLVCLLAGFTACGGDSDPAADPQPTPTPPPAKSYTAAPTGAGAYMDAVLTLDFKSTPTLGQSGLIRIYTSDGREVDRIDLADVAAQRTQMTSGSLYMTTMQTIGSRQAGYFRVVNYQPVRVDGMRVTIRPHYGALAYNTSYYVTVDRGAISAGDFSGIAASEWQFTTKAAPASRSAVSVGASGADFCSLQAALDYATDCGKDQAMVITLKNGVYEEQLYLRQKNNVTLRGESRDGVVIRYDNCELYAAGVGSNVRAIPALGQAIGASGGRGLMLLENCDMLRIENLTMHNTHGSGSQAEVVYNNDNSGTGRLAFVNCTILSAQDTFNLKGYNWFLNCLIAGDVDFIWGSVDTALFENCEIRSVNGGYIVQARCAAGKKGFVFLGCTLTRAAGANSDPVYLARTGSTSYSDNVTYVNCRMGAHIAPVGWRAPMSPATATAANGWKEYNSLDASGVKLDVSQRLAGTYQLTLADYEAGFRDRKTIFAGCSKGTEWLAE